MNRSLLKPFAAGAATVVLSGVVGWGIAENVGKRSFVILRYQKSGSYHGIGGPTDPYPYLLNVSGFVVATASKCKIKKWHLETEFACDAGDLAQLTVDDRDLSEDSFNCLAAEARPPVITLTRKAF